MRIRVLPKTVYTGGERLLEAEVVPRRRACFRWSATAGRLLESEGDRVLWESPRRPGTATIRLEVELESDGKLVEEARLEVRLPSTRGMVRIPGGVFRMGDTWTDPDDPTYIHTNQNRADKPAHLVKLSPYWIARDRVTNAEYAAFLQQGLEEGWIEVTRHAVLGLHRDRMVPFYRFNYDDMPRLQRKPPLRGAIRFAGGRFTVREGWERHPVVDVTWAGADAFARYYGKRLPTEAEWEFAARGTDNRRYPWGNELPTPKHANVNGYYGERLLPVGSFCPLGDSPFGIHDMVGGVFEWCHDWYSETYYADIYSERPVVDPKGPHWGRDHVLRGVPATQGINESRHEQPPLSFRYSWFFEFPIGDGFANAETGFRTAMDDFPGLRPDPVDPPHPVRGAQAPSRSPPSSSTPVDDSRGGTAP